MRAWIDQNEAAWQAFACASRKPYRWREYGFAPEAGPGSRTQLASSAESGGAVWDRSLISVMLPHLSGLLHLAGIGVWKSQLAARPLAVPPKAATTFSGPCRSTSRR